MEVPDAVSEFALQSMNQVPRFNSWRRVPVRKDMKPGLPNRTALDALDSIDRCSPPFGKSRSYHHNLGSYGFCHPGQFSGPRTLQRGVQLLVEGYVMGFEQRRSKFEDLL